VNAKIFTDVDGDPSSKRWIGAILITLGSALITSIGVAAIFTAIKDPATAITAGQTLIGTGAALLGISVLEYFRAK
jgi:hypothetical protein